MINQNTGGRGWLFRHEEFTQHPAIQFALYGPPGRSAAFIPGRINNPARLLPAPAAAPVAIAGLLLPGPLPVALLPAPAVAGLLPAGQRRRDKAPAQLLQSPSDVMFEIAMNKAPIHPDEITRLEQAVNEAVEAGRGGPLHDDYALRTTADVYILHHPHTTETLVVGILMPGEAHPTPVLRRGELRAYMLKVKDRYERRDPRPASERRVSESPAVNAVIADVARRLSQRRSV